MEFNREIEEPKNPRLINFNLATFINHPILYEFSEFINKSPVECD